MNEEGMTAGGLTMLGHLEACCQHGIQPLELQFQFNGVLARGHADVSIIPLLLR